MIGAAGRKSEKALAKRIGGRLTPNSGAAGMKGDIRVDGYLIEAKSSSAGSMAIARDWLIKIAREASMVGRRPALAITFTLPDGRQMPGGTWVMIPEIEFKEMVEAANAVRSSDKARKYP